MSAHRPPSPLLLAAELPRALWSVASLGWSQAMLRQAPRGDGRPVLVLPGVFNGDTAYIVLRRYLDRIGYRSHPWRLGANLGPRTIGDDGERLIDRIAAIAAEAGQKVTLVGVSLGGIMARYAAQMRPDLVREVVTVSAPFAGSVRATNVWRTFELVTGDRIDDERVVRMMAVCAKPLPVPATAIWSASDGLVSGQICHDATHHDLRSIHVSSGHVFVQMKPEVMRIIADVLAREAT